MIDTTTMMDSEISFNDRALTLDRLLDIYTMEACGEAIRLNATRDKCSLMYIVSEFKCANMEYMCMYVLCYLKRYF